MSDEHIFTEADVTRHLISARRIVLAAIVDALRWGMPVSEIADIFGLGNNVMAKASLALLSTQASPNDLADAIENATFPD